jgi:hypothetical protein
MGEQIYVDHLIRTVRVSRARWEASDDSRASRRPGPGKWSAKEELGHLIDSASNNHQ